MKRMFAAIAFLAFGHFAVAEEITLATYNIEYLDSHFLADRLSTSTLAQSPEGKAALTELGKKNAEDNWETAEVILDPKVNADILVIEEGCAQADLEAFNKEWLHGAYEMVIQFPGNSDRRQFLNLLMKPGFKVLATRDQYYLEPDPVGNERGERLFARGPVFVKVQTPAGKTLWVGVTHVKSKYVSGGSATPGANESEEIRQRRIDATKWRNRETTRTHAIIKELEKEGPPDVILLGDMNDSLGLDPYEPEAGGDAVENLVGPPEDGLFLATRALAGTGVFTFRGYWRENFREFIDHVVVTPSMKSKILSVAVYDEGLAKVSSDHLPVTVRIQTD